MLFLVKIFRALSDETRLKIIKLLSKSELCVCEIVSALGMIQPKVSFHLSILRKAQIVKIKRQGKWILYGLNEEDFFIRSLLLSVIERIKDEEILEELNRLEKFKKTLDPRIREFNRRECKNEGTQ